MSKTAAAWAAQKKIEERAKTGMTERRVQTMRNTIVAGLLHKSKLQAKQALTEQEFDDALDLYLKDELK